MAGPTMPDLIEITLLRHGRSLADDENKYEGRYDSPLTDVGRSQAQNRAQEWVQQKRTFDVAIASTLCRAHETAEIVCNPLGLPVETDPDWMEMDHGPLAGMPRDEADRLYPRPAFRGPFEGSAGSGESEYDLYSRAARALQKIIRRGPGRYLVVAHGGILNAAIRVICGVPVPVNRTGIRFAFGNLAYAVTRYDPLIHLWVIKEFHPGNYS
jgi:2,3-bisphosphoglycerate-dependent phosphoglycerate mutase